MDALKLKKESQISTTKTSWMSAALENIKEGSRNEGFTKVAGSLHARGYSADDIFNLLRGKAREVLFAEPELRNICESVSRYEVHVSRSITSMASNVESFLEDVEHIQWICSGLIARKTIGFVAGLPETMKTWAMMDFAVEAARGGGRWLGRFPMSGARVLFIDQERFKGETQRRFKAIIRGKGLEPRDLGQQLFIKCGTSIRIDVQMAFEAFQKELADIRPDVVIIDSFVTFHTKEENNRLEIQEVMERIKYLRNQFGCTFIFIDHENKGTFHAKKTDEAPSVIRMAGSIAKPSAAELVLTVRRHDSESSFIYHTKSTLAATIAPFLVKVSDMDSERTKIKVEAF